MVSVCDGEMVVMVMVDVESLSNRIQHHNNKNSDVLKVSSRHSKFKVLSMLRRQYK